ncbi:MAG: biopolymer transporter Tol [Gemmataceae bacterium]
MLLRLSLCLTLVGISSLAIMGFQTGCSAQPLVAAKGDDWARSEAKHLSNIRQVTFDFARAGEAYFSRDGKKIIFQAEETNTGNPFFQIFTQDLPNGAPRRISNGVGKTTCSFFRPDGKKIIYASTHLDLNAKEKYDPEVRQRAEDKAKGVRRRYAWDFDEHMDIFEADPDGSNLKQLTNTAGYDAEGSYSPDSKQIVFCSHRSGGLELWIMNADGTNPKQLTHSTKREKDGKMPYNGGPFYSPDGKRVIFRSDRQDPDHLQIYVINVDGTGEERLTAEGTWVRWGPFWHPDGKHIIYAGSDHQGRPNYDLYWLNLDTRKETRITYAPGADVLPVFNFDGKKLMWTSTRDGRNPSQIYLADFSAPD